MQRLPITFEVQSETVGLNTPLLYPNSSLVTFIEIEIGPFDATQSAINCSF